MATLIAQVGCFIPRIRIDMRSPDSPHLRHEVLVRALVIRSWRWCRRGPRRRRRARSRRCAWARQRSTSRLRRTSCRRTATASSTTCTPAPIVLDNGATTAALVTVDAGAIAEPLWQTVSQSIAKNSAFPTTHVLLTATHTHSAGGQRSPDYAQKIVEGGSSREAAAHAGPRRVWDRRVVHQRQPADHRPEDRPLVGRTKPRGPVGQDGGGGEVRDGQR